MRHYLRGHGLLKFVDGSYSCPSQFQKIDNNTDPYEIWLQQDSSAVSMIVDSLSPEALILVTGCETSMEVWTTLKQRYAPNSEFHVAQLKSRLQNIRKGSDSIEKYLLRFKDVQNHLAVVGKSMSDEDMKYLILAGLPSTYAHTRQIIRSKNYITMEEVRCLLLSAESEIELEHKALLSYSLAASNVGFLPTNMTSGIPAYNHYMTSSCASNVHHYNASSPFFTTHFGIQQSMIPCSAFGVSNASPNFQDQPLFTNVGVPQSVSSSGYMLNNSAENANYISSSAPLYGYAPQGGNSMVQNGGFIPQNGGHILRNGGYTPTLHHNHLQQQRNTTSSGTHTTPAFGTIASGPAFGQSHSTTPGQATLSSCLETIVVNNSIQPTSVTSSKVFPRDMVAECTGHTSDKIKGVDFFCHENDSYIIDNHTDISKGGDKFMDRVMFVTHADRYIELDEQIGGNMTEVPFIEAETGSDVSNESSFSCSNNNMNKPQKLNDEGWEAIQIVRDHDRTMGLNHYKNRHLMNCRKSRASTTLWRSLPLIPPG